MLELFLSIYCFLFNLLWSFPPLLFFPRRRLKFLHGQIFHIALCDICIYVILRKIFRIPDIEKTFIRILFCCTLIGLSTHILAMYIKTYIHMCINVGFFPLKRACIFNTNVQRFYIFVSSPVCFDERRSQVGNPTLFKHLDSWLHTSYWIICLFPDVRTLLRQS